MSSIASISNQSVSLPSFETKNESVDQDYAALISQFYDVKEYKTPDEVNASDTELQKFKDDLLTKGAAVFLKDLNQEKIDAMVEKYREKLLKEQAENPDKPMDINQMVSDFKKELLKEMMEAQKADKDNKPIQNSALMSSDILENIKTARNNEQSTLTPNIGFLEQALNASNTQSSGHKKEL